MMFSKGLASPQTRSAFCDMINAVWRSATFRERVSSIPQFPRAWVAALESVGGIYLLVADDGAQYVGSATGAFGFMGRWRAYLADGHGGNKILRQAGYTDYDVCIPEIAGPDMSERDVLAREVARKRKLGTRATGLNVN